MELRKLLRSVEMFSGLTDEQLTKLMEIFKEETRQHSDVLFSQGDEADCLYLIREGFVEVLVESSGAPSSKSIVNLGPGQSVGEMALVDSGGRSATCRVAADNTILAMVTRADFERLCEGDTAIGYRVMRNIAADLSFRLRRRSTVSA